MHVMSPLFSDVPQLPSNLAVLFHQLMLFEVDACYHFIKSFTCYCILFTSIHIHFYQKILGAKDRKIYLWNTHNVKMINELMLIVDRTQILARQ